MNIDQIVSVSPNDVIILKLSSQEEDDIVPLIEALGKRFPGSLVVTLGEGESFETQTEESLRALCSGLAEHQAAREAAPAPDLSDSLE